MEKAHEEEQARLMREEEVRVLKRQAMERARKIEEARRALHVARLDAYEERKAEVLASLETRTRKEYVGGDDSMDEETVEEYPLSEVEKAQGLLEFARNALLAVAGNSDYVPQVGKGGEKEGSEDEDSDSDSDGSERGAEGDGGDGGESGEGDGMDGEGGEGDGMDGEGGEGGEGVGEGEEEEEGKVEDRLGNMLSEDGKTGAELFAQQVTSEWTAESNPHLFKVLSGVMLMLGYTRGSTEDGEKRAELVTRESPSVFDLMARVDFGGLPKPSKLQRVARATQGLDARSLVSLSPLGSYPAYVAFEWLKAGVALRNAVVNERLNAGEPLDEIEDQTFRVGEPGEPEAELEEDYESGSDWQDLFDDDEGANSAASYEKEDPALEYSMSGSYYEDSQYDY